MNTVTLEEPSNRRGIWMAFVHELDTECILYIEPYGNGWEMPKGKYFYVYVLENSGGSDYPPIVVYNHDCIQVYTEDPVVYQEDELLLDLSDGAIPSPLERYEQSTKTEE